MTCEFCSKHISSAEFFVYGVLDKGEAYHAICFDRKLDKQVEFEAITDQERGYKKTMAEFSRVTAYYRPDRKARIEI